MINLVADIILALIMIAFITNEFKWLLWAVAPNLLPGSVKLEIEEMKRNGI